MSRTNQFALILILQVVLIALFLGRAPFMMTVKTPPTKNSWADHPCKLITTPLYATDKTDIFTTGATHMAHIHNAILRGYNSIFLQAPHVRNEDKEAFIGYALTWFKFVKSHHDDEEAELFPKVAEVLHGQDNEIWEETHKEHESFLQGLGKYEIYLSHLASPAHFDGKELCSIMLTFQVPFEHHFHSEITHISSFASLPSAPVLGSPESDQAVVVFKAWGKKTVTKAGTTDVVPFFLMNLDATYEEGKWANWPPMPAPVRWGLVNVAGSWNWAWWKFASCNSAGTPRELYALGGSGGRDSK
ncbi:hypothetical protein C7974DRAFT_196764 [Boeremia exigua]|uniref:uncharacterized protein n=1 Tax=Boeremia exigua TaxID=749465 RepID=UPI001E8D62D2|nr:uncharacterized protein C7974DRAFT_196764 [Boeremia exigua]KAH6625244.1 hypothetical protein C7974DRAFT_196764 [Boeremia exigua]